MTRQKTFGILCLFSTVIYLLASVTTYAPNAQKTGDMIGLGALLLSICFGLLALVFTIKRGRGATRAASSGQGK